MSDEQGQRAGSGQEVLLDSTQANSKDGKIVKNTIVKIGSLSFAFCCLHGSGIRVAIRNTFDDNKDVFLKLDELRKTQGGLRRIRGTS